MRFLQLFCENKNIGERVGGCRNSGGGQGATDLGKLGNLGSLGSALCIPTLAILAKTKIIC